MKKISKQKLLIIGLISVLIVIFILLGFIFNDKNNGKNSSNKKDPLEKVDVNNLTNDKTIDGLKIGNIIISGDDRIIITVDITNTTDNDYPATKLNFVLIDGEGKILNKIPTEVSNIKVGEKETITVDVTGYYGASRDFRLERR